MSLKITRKGYYVLKVGGVSFSNHVEPREGYEKASQALAADPTLKLLLAPPVIEIVEDGATVQVPIGDPVPVTSDGGEDLIDFLARIQGIEGPGPNPVLIEASSYEDYLNQAAIGSKGTWLIRRIYWPVNGERVWIGIVWRGYVLVWNNRDKTAIRIGGGA